jgi:hypothetical protein
VELISSSEIDRASRRPLSPYLRDTFARARENDEALVYAQLGFFLSKSARRIGFGVSMSIMDNSYRLHCGVLAKLITPGSNEPQGFILDNSGHRRRVHCHLPGTSSAGIEPMRVRVSSGDGRAIDRGEARGPP